MRFTSISRALVCAVVLFASSAFAVVPDNGFGTAHTPILADHTGQGAMQIINGLPVGTTIDIPSPVLTSPTSTGYELPGGSLGGTKGAAIGSVFQWNLQGTGALLGYNRNIVMPLGDVASFPPPAPLLPGTNSAFEVHTAPRVNGAPVQSFDTDMFRLFGQITGDPDFDLLRVVAGTDFGLPSPGHTTLTQAGPNWNVDSFFDLTYRIDFVGHPGGPLSGRSGSTTGTIRISVPEPACLGMLLTAAPILMRRARQSAR